MSDGVVFTVCVDCVHKEKDKKLMLTTITGWKIKDLQNARQNFRPICDVNVKPCIMLCVCVCPCVRLLDVLEFFHHLVTDIIDVFQVIILKKEKKRNVSVDLGREYFHSSLWE